MALCGVYLAARRSRAAKLVYGLTGRISPMRDASWQSVACCCVGAACLLFAPLATASCHRGEVKTHKEPAATAVTVEVVHPERRNITRTVGQPSFVEAYERASIYPKVTSYIERWYVDIGDKVKRGQVLADLFAPEIVEDYRTKAATVQFDKQQIQWAIEQVKVAKADVQAAAAILARYEAQVVRWDVQVKRLRRETERGVVDPQVLLESENQLRASIASRASAVADLESKKAAYERSKVAVDVAKARLGMAISDWRRQGAWVGYLKLYAPFNGIIEARNANTGDFVLPRLGDPTADKHAPHMAPGKTAAPVYVVVRTDVVRVFVDIPEADAAYVKRGSKASVLVKAFRDQPITAAVTRTSWALNDTSRTLRAEIDLDNTNIPKQYRDLGSHQMVSVGDPHTSTQILPGMYAYGTVVIERPNAMVVPEDAIVHVGGKDYCWFYQNGKAVRVEIETGISDSKWTEVLNRRVSVPGPHIGGNQAWNGIYPGFFGRPGPLEEGAAAETVFWKPLDGSERVIVGDFSNLSQEAPVQVRLTASVTSQPRANPASGTTLSKIKYNLAHK